VFILLTNLSLTYLLIEEFLNERRAKSDPSIKNCNFYGLNGVIKPLRRTKFGLELNKTFLSKFERICEQIHDNLSDTLLIMHKPIRNVI
jgi:hypothetical protein